MSHRTADVAIIGGGIIGLSCAYELARQGAGRVVLFDKQNLATGTTGGSAGVVCLHDMGEIYASLTLIGYERIQYLQREYDFSFNAWGQLNVVYEPGDFPPTPNEYEQFFCVGGRNSIYHKEYLDKEELIHRYPWIKPERVKGGVFSPNQGFIDPYALVSLYEKLALQTGRVEIFRNTPVLQIRTQEDQITTLVTRRGAWDVGKVVNAGGPWGAKVSEMAGSELALTPQRAQVCVATTFDDGVEQAPLSSIPESLNDVGIWCRGELGGTMIFGPDNYTTRHRPGFTVDPDYVNRVNDPEYPQEVEEIYRRYYHLPKSMFLNGWCCVYGTTDDGHPIISRDTRLQNFYHAVGMNGHGITIHSGVALLIAELLLRNNTTLDLEPVLHQPLRLDLSALDAGRFTRGELLDFKLRNRWISRVPSA